jgi:hypothetical protein
LDALKTNDLRQTATSNSNNRGSSSVTAAKSKAHVVTDHLRATLLFEAASLSSPPQLVRASHPEHNSIVVNANLGNVELLSFLGCDEAITCSYCRVGFAFRAIELCSCRSASHVGVTCTISHATTDSDIPVSNQHTLTKTLLHFIIHRKSCLRSYECLHLERRPTSSDGMSTRNYS